MAHGPTPGGGAPAGQIDRNYRAGRVIWLSIVAAMGGFLFGFDSAVVNGAVSAIQNKFELSSNFWNGIGIVVAIALLGSAVGAWFAGSLASKFGRKRVMVVAAVLFIIAALGQAFPFDVWDLMFWRFIGGAGIGIASVIAPMYIAEIAPAQMRGRLGSLQQLAIVTGIFATAVSNYVILQLATNNGTVTEGAVTATGEPIYARNEWLLGLEAWQWMFLIMVIPAIVYGILALTIPESPRYLVSIGKSKEAEEVLETVFTGSQSEKVAEIEQSLAGETKPKFSDLKGASLGLKPIVWVGILLSIFQQFVGINVIFYYSNSIWTAAGFSEDQAFLVTLITNTTNVVVTFIAIALVDKIGRKPLLLIGSAGMAVSLLIMAIVFGTAPIVDGQPVLEGLAKPGAVISANAYVVFFGVSWGPVVWVLLGEMFPNKIRAAALAVAAAAQWLANFVVTALWPQMASFSLAFGYGVFTVMAIISFFFVLKFVKETKGKTLESMAESMAAD
ncbi:MAG: sugar porter family MFS transporter [Actinobacteria bacterium]|nr:sugar porter family MFS transporter [Actinomycetota bacterium]